MEEQRIDHQINGTWPDIFGYGLPREHCIAWHRMLNDTLAEWTADNAKRFSWISSVPLIDAEAAAQELERTMNAGAVGVIISANIENVNIGELPLDPFWRKAEALGVPVLLHPVLSTAVPRVGKFALAQIAHYTYDTTLGGRLHPDDRRARPLSEAQAAAVAWRRHLPLSRRPLRYDAQAHGQGRARAMSRRRRHRLMRRRCIYDSIVHAPKALRFLIDIAGIDNVHLGTDYSFPPADMEPLDLLKAAGLSKADSEAISDGNPRKLFTRLK